MFAVVRGVEVKYRKPAAATLLAFGAPDENTRCQLVTELTNRSRFSAVVLVDLKDGSGALTLQAVFTWFLSRQPSQIP